MEFLSTLSLRRATLVGEFVDRVLAISIHALLAESDHKRQSATLTAGRISIHALLAESDRTLWTSCCTLRYFYPRSPCGERRTPVLPGARLTDISIHALLAESDGFAVSAQYSPMQFLSTLSLRRATGPGRHLWGGRKFLSTLSLRRATPLRQNALHGRFYFYPRSPCGERLERLPDAVCLRLISIHALLAESDNKNAAIGKPTCYFYPRSPCGERLVTCSKALAITSISIHALLAESDAIAASCFFSVSNFYPRSPCGERLKYLQPCRRSAQFLSTLSLRRATWGKIFTESSLAISIHALLAESDFLRPERFRDLAISIHALLAESDL